MHRKPILGSAFSAHCHHAVHSSSKYSGIPRLSSVSHFRCQACRGQKVPCVSKRFAWNRIYSRVLPEHLCSKNRHFSKARNAEHRINPETSSTHARAMLWSHDKGPDSKSPQNPKQAIQKRGTVDKMLTTGSQSCRMCAIFYASCCS
jgi:hypothetical protein